MEKEGGRPSTDMSVFRHKTLSIELTEQTVFTTEPKHPRRGNRNRTIRLVCSEFMSWLERLGYEKIPAEQARIKFQEWDGPRDRATMKAYFGTLPGTTERLIDRTAHYATGTISVKKIHLRQAVEKRVGYLELLKLVSYEKLGKTWFMILNNESPLVPEMGLSPTRVKESCAESILDFSLTPKHLGESTATAPTVANLEAVENIETTEKRERVIGCERNRIGKIGEPQDTRTPKPQLTPLEEAVLKAQPYEREKPLPKIGWVKEPFKPQFEDTEDQYVNGQQNQEEEG